MLTQHKFLEIETPFLVKYTPGGACEIFIKDVGCNGLAVTADGN